jgi:HK97 family phage portal protein
MMHAILTHGEAFAFVGRARGQVHEIVQAAPRAITTDVDTVTGEPIFRATGSDGHPRVIPREEIVRVHLPGPDPVKGLSLVHEGRDTIGLLMAITQYSANLFRNGARPSGILAIDGKLTKDQRDFMDAYLREHYAGMNSGKTMLLENGARFSPITMTSMDAQVIEQWRHLIAEVARIFRVPLHLIGDLERATSLNS